MAIYLSSYYPLACNAHGIRAVERYSYPKFIDGSCRREPDFEHPVPAITALCRPNFVTKLKPGDIVIYITNKKGLSKRYVTAALRVIAIKKSHLAALRWYIKKDHRKIPNNIICSQNSFYNLDHTHRLMGWWGSRRITTVFEWNQFYIDRVNENPMVAICKPFKHFINPRRPSAVSETSLRSIFEKVPVPQTPNIVTKRQWSKLKRKLGI